MLQTKLVDLLKIKHPILQGGMAWVSRAPLVSAVSEGGGLGIIGSGNAPPEFVCEQITRVRACTKAPFGVNVPLFSPYVDDVIALCIEHRVPVVTTGAGSPGSYIAPLHEAGILILPLVSSVALARRLAGQGADALIVEGHESGGHTGDVSTMPLIPQVVDAVDIPVVAAGGIADGRGLAAALALGAAGVQMGTRFICATECSVHANYKSKIVHASDRSTIITGATLAHPVRAIKNRMSRQFARLERTTEVSEEELIAFGTGKLRLAAEEGDVVGGSVMAGEISGLIDDVMPAAELISRIVAQAESRIACMAEMVTEQQKEYAL